MLSRVVKEHNQKQAEHKELQGRFFPSYFLLANMSILKYMVVGSALVLKSHFSHFLLQSEGRERLPLKLQS